MGRSGGKLEAARVILPMLNGQTHVAEKKEASPMRTACTRTLAAATEHTMWMGRSKPGRWGTLFALSMLALLWATGAHAHTELNQWFTHGPEGPIIVYSIAINPADTNVVYAGTTDGVYKSTDGGESWEKKSNGLPLDVDASHRTVFALAVDPQNSSIVYAGTDFNCPAFPCSPEDPDSDVFKSDNGGESWTPIGMLVVGSGVQALALDPTPVAFPATQRTLYVGFTGSSCPGPLCGGVYKSTDGGASFTRVLDGDVRALALVADAPDILYAGAGPGEAVYKTDNGGDNWTPATNGLPICGFIGLCAVRSLAIDPTDSDVVYAATSGGGVYKTTDGGMNWAAANTGQTDLNATSVVIDPTPVLDPLTQRTVYAGTTGGGVFKSTDSGASWVAFNDGLFNTNVQSLGIVPCVLYAGTSADGVFVIHQVVHDLAVTKITAPKTAKAASPVTKSVKVEIQNRSPHNETVEAGAGDLGDGTSSGLVRLVVSVMDSDNELCQAATVLLDDKKNAALFKKPKVLKPKAKLTIYYLVTYNCTNPSMLATGGDYNHVASVHHTVLDGQADSHGADDTCPHDALPLGIDPNPDGKIKDKGCGTKKADKTFGDPVVTDVLKK